MTATEELIEIMKGTIPKFDGAPDIRQNELPHDPLIFVEDVLQYGFMQWGKELGREGHTLQINDRWIDRNSHYPGYSLRTAEGRNSTYCFTESIPTVFFCW